MGSDYGVGNMSSILQGSRLSSQQSIISALNKFVQAVNVMDQTVMIPSRLRDMDACVDLNGAVPSIPVENNNQLALLPVPGPTQANLFSFYTMLHAIKQELVTGGPASEYTEDGGQEGGTDQHPECCCSSSDSKPTAAAFRYHLTSLLGMLRQMTATADYLTTRYEHELDQSSPQFSSWALQ